MQPTTEQKPSAHIDRRNAESQGNPPGPERRQFRDAYAGMRPEVIELGEAIDRYKLRHRRRFITFEELYDVMTELGYQK